MTKLTEMQTAVLLAFPGYDDPMETKGDLGASWTDATELAAEAELTVKQVKGVLASLSKRGLVYADEEGGHGGVVQCLTEEGCDVLAELQAAMDQLELPMTDPSFAARLITHGGRNPAARYAAVQAVAREWQGTEEEFMSGATEAGIHHLTALICWRQARRG